MQRVFEGVLGFWGGGRNYEARIGLMLHVDLHIQRLYVRAWDRDHWIGDEVSFRADQMLMLRLRRNSTHIAHQFVSAQRQRDPGFGTFLQSLIHHDPRGAGGPSFSFDLPGASMIRNSKGWSDIAFTPYNGVPIDFSAAFFYGLNFKNVDFRQANITGAFFTRTRFENCQFSGSQLAGGRLGGVRFCNQTLNDLDLFHATLKDATFESTNFSRCRLTSVDCKNIKVDNATFSDCRCDKTSFDGMTGKTLAFVRCDLIDTSFDEAKVDGWSFTRSVLRRTSFREATLLNACFAKTRDHAEPLAIEDIDLDAADLSGADFTGVNLVGNVRYARAPRFGQSADTRTILVRASFNLSFLGSDGSYIDATDAKITYDIDATAGIDLFQARYALLPVMELAGFRLSRADFSHARLRAARFGNATLRDADFTGAMLEGADFTGARLDAAVFSNATLSAANFTSAWLTEAKFENTTLGDTNFAGAMLHAVSFARLRGRSLSGVNFSNAFLAQADFKDVVATMSGSKQTSFAGACLAGADFTDAQLADALLTNAQVAAASGTITVNFPGRPKREVEYEPTCISPSSTSPHTICPDGNSGRCTLERLQSRPVKAVWPG